MGIAFCEQVICPGQYGLGISDESEKLCISFFLRSRQQVSRIMVKIAVIPAIDVINRKFRSGTSEFQHGMIG